MGKQVREANDESHIEDNKSTFPTAVVLSVCSFGWSMFCLTGIEAQRPITNCFIAMRSIQEHSHQTECHIGDQRCPAFPTSQLGSLVAPEKRLDYQND